MDGSCESRLIKAFCVSKVCVYFADDKENNNEARGSDRKGRRRAREQSACNQYKLGQFIRHPEWSLLATRRLIRTSWA